LQVVKKSERTESDNYILYLLLHLDLRFKKSKKTAVSTSEPFLRTLALALAIQSE